ncbi:META domain-containing protein [Ornithobacterium rhinotracheale]|uniref:META domain-containing protein n=1 Tax=Ornithobacterium rhinotracheale TaxID=28251 RepID=UPI00129CF16B|nr:META domain-containing protein [Ornithobacterium rhinotracheale]MRI63574.1 META domain-containing protein [Ornithobacterium rhinotracheale]
MKKISILFVMAILLFSCDALSPIAKGSTDIAKLYGNWILQNNKDAELGFNASPLSINFQKEDTEIKVNGFAGCNRFFGPCTAQAGVINFSNLASTRMACPQLDIENRYLSLLGKSNRYEIKGKDLYLYQNNLLLLHFKR